MSKSKQHGLLVAEHLNQLNQLPSIIPSHEKDLKIVFVLQCRSEWGVGATVYKLHSYKPCSTSLSLLRALQDNEPALHVARQSGQPITAQSHS